MSVDILAIGNNNRKKQEQDMSTNIIQPAWIQKEKYYSENMMDQPETKVTVNPLDRQVEIGVGSKIDTPMSRKEKQIYADGLSDYDRNLMKLYKAEGYSFEASKKLVENKDRLLNPQARGIDKYDNYQIREMLSKLHSGQLNVGTDTTMGKIIDKEMKIWNAMSPENNIIKQWMDKYQERAGNQLGAYQQLDEGGEANRKDWLGKVLVSAGYGVSEGIEDLTSGVLGQAQNFANNVTARLENLILGTDIDPNFYNQRTNEEYEVQAESGLTSSFFWTAGMPIMLTFTALGNTKLGGDLLSAGDEGLTKLITMAIKNTPAMPYSNGYLIQYSDLDEKGKEDMVEGIKDAIYLRAFGQAGKLKANSRIGIAESQLKSAIKNAFNEAVKGVKEQTKAEVRNVREATDLYNEGGQKIGSMGPEGRVGVGESINRVVQRGVNNFKQYFTDRYNARYGSTSAEPGAEIPTEEPVAGKPNNESKGVVDKVKDVVDTKITGLTPEERIRVVNDPYTKEKREKARNMLEEAGIPLEESFITEQLYNEVGDKILQVFDEWENKLQNTLPEYRALRELNTTYNLIEATPLLTDLLLKNDITQDPVSGELDFSNSKFVSDADMRSVQRAIDMIYKDINTLVTPRQYLNLRDKLDQLAKYTTMDASRGQSLIRQIRHTLDGVAKKQIPGLKELDDTTSKYFKEIAELKDGWVYKESTRKGQVRNNFYSIIKNLTGHNRKVMLQRLEKYYPGIGEEIEAIHIAEKLVRLYNKSPQMIKALGIGGGLGGLATGSVTNAILWSIFGALIEDNVINPMAKSLRRKKIDKLLSELSPEAKAKLEEIALRQTYAKEMSEEDKRVLEGVAEIIRQENERGLSEEAIRERERRTRPLDQEALPGIQPDIVDENGNITLGRGNVISPEKGPGRARRLTRITEINLKNPETTPDKQVLDLQEKLDIDTDTAKEIQYTIDDFLKEVGADENGVISGREVDYNKFSNKSLEGLMNNDNLPRTEKDKIEKILMNRTAETEAGDRADLDKEFAYRIKKLEEEELRVGKIGRNKVSKEIAQKQQDAVDDKRDKLIEEMRERYGGNERMDQERGQDKFEELSMKSVDFANSYKRTKTYKTETAEREVLDSLMEGWSKQPKFVRDMDDNQLKIRQDFLNNVELQNGYKLETTDYNDRYILEDNGSIVDRGAIKYIEDGTIEITAQTFDGIKESGLLDYLPDNTEIKESGSDLWMSARELKGTPLSDTWIRNSEGKIVPLSEVQNYYDFADKTPIDKFDGELTEQQIQEGKDLYQLASESLTPETENEIIEARGKFLTLNQRPGYTKALGLDQGEVNKTIMSWQRMSPELKNFVDKVHSKADPKYRFMGMSNWIEKDNPWRGIDSLKFLTDDVKAVDKDPNIRSYELEIRDTLDGIMLGNSKLSYETLRIRLTHREEQNAFNKELNSQKAVGEFFSDIDMLIAGEGKETVWHEEGHYISSLLGRKILGNRKAFDKGVREATSRDWERWWSSRYKSPEVGEFHEKILKLVESLDKSLTPEMKNDNRIMSDGTVAKDYRAKPDEKRARFWSASIEFTKRIAQTGKIPTKTFKSEHGDEYTLKQYENLLDILQEYQRLEDKGLFYEVEVPNETRVNMRTGLKDIQQQSLFDQEPDKNVKMRYFKKRNDMNTELDNLVGNRGISGWRFFEATKKTYDKDLNKRLESINKYLEDNVKNDNVFRDERPFQEEELIDIYTILKEYASDEEVLQLMKNDNNPDMNEAYNTFRYINANPLEIPEEFKNEQWLGPLRGALYELKGTGLMDLVEDYNPDIVEWAHNLKNRTFSKVTMSELTNINNLLENYIDNADLDIPVKGTFADDEINGLIDAVRNSRRYKSKISTYDQKQILKVARETEEILDNRLKQTDLYYQHINPDREGFEEEDKAMARDKADQLADEYEDFKEQFIYVLGDTYDPNVDKWHNNIKKWLKDNLDKFEGFLGVSARQRGEFVQPHQLNSLKAKIKELDKYSQQDIQSVYEGTYTDAFMRAVRPRIEELQAKGTDKAVTNLIALSDMSVENFERQMKGFGGKSPMPSIAVQDPNVPSGSFGDLTVLFGRETVDPEIDKRNKLYGSDAWTPMFPSTKMKKGMVVDDPYKNEEIRPLVDDVISRGADITSVEGDKLVYGIYDALTRRGNLGQLKKRRRDNNITAIKEYVEDLVNDAGEEAGIGWSMNEATYYELAGQLFDLIIGKGSVEKINPNWRDYPEVKDIEEILSDIPEEDRKKRMEAFDKRMGHAYVEETTNPRILAHDIDNEITRSTGVNIILLETKTDTFDNVISKMSDMIWKLKNATQVIPASYFDEKTSPKYMAVDGVAKKLADIMFDGDTPEKAEYENNVANFIKKNIHADSEKLYESIQQYYGNFGDQWWLAKQSLRQLDNKEMGDRPLTPENVLEAMKNQKVNRETTPGSFRDMIEIEGTKVNNLEDVRKRNFAKVYHGDRVGELGDLEDRYYNLIDIVYDYALEYESGEGMGETEIKGAIKIDIADSYDTDVKKFRENLEEADWLWEGVPNEVLQRIIDVVEQGRKIPIRFSESKPERVVDLMKEVKYVLVPKRKKARVDDIVKGTPLEGKVIDYKEDDNIPYRTKKIKELQKKYGNIFFSMGGVVMPIAMLRMMMNGEDEGQA